MSKLITAFDQNETAKIDIKKLKTDREYWDSVAPPLATHYSKVAKKDIWLYMQDEQNIFFYEKDKDVWTLFQESSDALPYMQIKRPEFKNVWTGPEEGRPPLFHEIERYNSEKDVWERGCFVFYDEKYMIWRNSETLYGTVVNKLGGMYRAIMTAEILAIDAMMVAAEKSDDPFLSSKSTATRIYEAIQKGFIPGVYTNDSDQNEIQTKYNELLYAVQTKHPNESRHETALRYIKNSEKTDMHENQSCEK